MAKYKRPEKRKPSRYEKPGKGVSKEDAKKRGTLHLFKVFFRNIRKLVLINLLYFAVLFPVACAVTVFALSNQPDFINLVSDQPITQQEVQQEPVAAQDDDTEVEEERNWLQKLIDSFPIFSLIMLATVGVISLHPALVWLLLIILIASIILYGPITAGITFCMRNFSREEHAWISDVWTRAKRNWKQGLVFGLLDLLVLFGVVIYNFTPAEQFFGIPENSLPVLKYFSTAIGVLYYIMRGYVYLMVVTFDLKIKTILKNAFSFAVLGIKHNIITLVMSLGIIFVTVVSGYLSFFLILLAALSLIHFISVYNSYLSVDKYMVQPALAEKSASDVSDEQTPIFKDTISNDADKKK